MRSKPWSLALVAALSLALTLPVPLAASPSSSAAFFVEQGKAAEASGEWLAAMKRYSQALEIDPSHEPAWLALGNLRASRKELADAEDVFTEGLARVPLSIDLAVARARVRRQRGNLDDAERDLRRALVQNGADRSPREIAILRERVALARDAKSPPMELASWRRLREIARANADTALLKESSLQVRALGLYLGPLDPVLRGRASEDPLRAGLAAIARRGG